MSFSFQVTGLDEILAKMDQLPKQAARVAALALYEGAGVMADSVGQAVQGIATKKFKYPAPPGKMRMPSPEEKAVLMNARHGVAKFRNTGTEINTSVGWRNAGYGTINGKTVPVPKIAAAIESGTSFMKKQPFFRKSVNRAKGPAAAAVESGIKSREDMLSID